MTLNELPTVREVQHFWCIYKIIYLPHRRAPLDTVYRYISHPYIFSQQITLSNCVKNIIDTRENFKYKKIIYIY